jgi:hypothetical protein
MLVFVFTLPLVEPVPLTLPVPVSLEEPVLVPDVAPVFVLVFVFRLLLVFVFDAPVEESPLMVEPPDVDGLVEGLALPCADDEVLSCEVDVPCVPAPTFVDELWFVVLV